MAGDSTGRAIAGITVALNGTADSTVTASDGSFELPFVQPGSYTLVLRHAALDSLGVEHLGRAVEVEPGRSPPIDILFPSNEDLAHRMCGERLDFQRVSVVRVLVVDATTGEPFANAPAILSRVPLDANPATAHMFIVKPFAGQGLMSLFSTHPPTEARVKALLEGGY